jgi:hypothetical protein
MESKRGLKIIMQNRSFAMYRTNSARQHFPFSNVMLPASRRLRLTKIQQTLAMIQMSAGEHHHGSRCRTRLLFFVCKFQPITSSAWVHVPVEMVRRLTDRRNSCCFTFSSGGRRVDSAFHLAREAVLL